MTSTTARPPQATGNRRNQHQPSSHQYYYSGTPSYYSSSSSPSLIKGCCCCLFLLFSLIALIILAVILVVVLAVKPKKPLFDLQEVAVQNIGIVPSAPGGGGATLSLSIRLMFTAANPNKVGIKYGESRFTVMYRGIPLGRGSVPGFYQPADSVKTVATVVAVDRVNLMQADATDLLKDASVYDKVELRVLGDVSAKIRIISFDSPGVQVSVDCAIVISPRKQSLTYKQCGGSVNRQEGAFCGKHNMTLAHCKVVNHGYGVPECLMKDIVKMTETFFNLPKSETKEYEVADVLAPVRSGTSYSFSAEQTHFWRDFLKVVISPVFNSPTKPNGFRSLPMVSIKACILHRVMVNKNNVRVSVAIANGPALDAIVEPAASRSERIEAANFRSLTYRQYLEIQQSKPLDGKSGLDLVRVHK